MRRTLVPALVAALALTLSVTACGAEDDDPGVATLDGSSGDDGGDGDGGDGGDGGEPASEEDLEEQALAFSECMRENGVPDFPDPEIEDGGIRMRVGGPDGGGEIDQEAMEKAMEACEELAPRGGGSFSEEDRQEMQDAMLEYAQCMRDNGYDMPDPDFSDGGGMFRLEGEADDPAFKKAQEACEDKLPGRPGEDG
jgi:hypothetical protein